MLEEVFGFFVSIVSLFTSDLPQVSHSNSQVETSATLQESESEANDSLWKIKIHREYQPEDRRQLSRELTYIDVALPNRYVSVGSESRIRNSLCQSIQRSLRVNPAILVAVFPLGLVVITFLYLDLNTTDLCLEWQHHNNSISDAVIGWRLIGVDIQTILIFLWFPVTLILLFGWPEFQLNYIATLYVSFATGATVVIYKTFLFVFGIFGRTKDFYVYGPGNVLFVVDVVWGSVLVARKINRVHPLISKLQIFTVISFGFVAGLSSAYVYRYAADPLFHKLENQTYKLLVAAMIPVLAFLLTAICKYFILHRSAEIIQPEHSFLLVYFLRGAAICIYRTIQADFNNIWLFVGLSLFSGFSNVVKQITRRIREKIWSRFIECLRSTIYCRRLEQIPSNTPHHRRLTADIEIQDMLFEYTTLVMSQVYIVLYRITSFKISFWPVLKESLFRIFIGLGIDFVFNCLSIFIQIHWYDIPIRTVWVKYWKRHMLANAIILIATICYFTPCLLSILRIQIRTDSSTEELRIRNCTFMPFKNG